jgi:hypothetical protein
MKPAPYPPPPPELCEAFGSTSYYAQKLERELKLFLLACHYAGRIKLDLKKFRTAEDFLDRKTLGQLHDQLQTVEQQQGYEHDSDFPSRLEQAVENRNLLAHRFFQNYEPGTASEKLHIEMQKQLGEIRLSVGNAFLILRELRKVAERQFGITEEDIEAILSRADDNT